MRGTNSNTLYTIPCGSHVKYLSGLGVKYIRVCFVPPGYGNNPANQSEFNYGNWDATIDAQLDIFDDWITACKPYGIKLIPIIGQPPGGLIPGANPPAHKIFKTPRCARKLVDTWIKIAHRYVDEPTVFGYDICGGPGFNRDYYNPACEKWPQLAITITEAIHNIDPSKYSIIEPVNENGALLGKLGVTARTLVGHKVMFSPHCYDPLRYTGQQIPGTKYLKDVTYPADKFTKSFLLNAVAPIRAFQLKYNVPIYIGEFSAVRWAPGGNTWVKDMMDIFESYGWGWTYFDYWGYNGWSWLYPPDHSQTGYPGETERCALLKTYFAKDSV